MTPRRALALLGAALACGACAPVAPPGAASDEQAPRLAAGAARGTQCVAEPAFMRRNHMDLLKHQRDETVHRGVRDTKSSLKGCIECHASTDTGSVAQGPKDFCVRCHSYAAVKVDCFECHSTRPSTTAFLPLRHPPGPGVDSPLLAQWSQRLKQGVPP